MERCSTVSAHTLTDCPAKPMEAARRGGEQSETDHTPLHYDDAHPGSSTDPSRHGGCHDCSEERSDGRAGRGEDEVTQRCVDVRGWVQAPANQQQSAGGEDSENEPVHDDRDHDVACRNLVPQCPRTEDESTSDAGERIDRCPMVGSECVGGEPGSEETRDHEGNNRGDKNNLTSGIAAVSQGSNPDTDDPPDPHGDGSGGGSQSVSRDEFTTVDHMRHRGR